MKVLRMVKSGQICRHWLMRCRVFSEAGAFHELEDTGARMLKKMSR